MIVPAPLFLLLTAQSPGSGSALLPFLIQGGAIFAIFYFLMIRPQQKTRQQQEQRLNSLRKGDEVVTAGGIIGEVLHIKETLKDGSAVKTMEDRVTIKSAESRLVVERGRIARVLSPEASASTPSSSA
ncbi:MAG: hypothetical protein NVS4B3_14690 [Gemmatimonadaceae bacterium]